MPHLICSSSYVAHCSRIHIVINHLQCFRSKVGSNVTTTLPYLLPDLYFSDPSTWSVVWVSCVAVLTDGGVSGNSNSSSTRFSTGKQFAGWNIDRNNPDMATGIASSQMTKLSVV